MLSRWTRIRAFLAALPFIGRLFPAYWRYFGKSIVLNGQTRIITDYKPCGDAQWDVAPVSAVFQMRDS